MKREGVRALWRQAEAAFFRAQADNGLELTLHRLSPRLLYVIWEGDQIIAGGHCRTRTKERAVVEAVRYLLKETP